MVEMFPLKSADAAYNKVSGMLETLGDLLTKIICPKCVNLVHLLVLNVLFAAQRLGTGSLLLLRNYLVLMITPK
ncbi:hypothetical protein QJS04_geneDACA014707 [Acorus gramineus]|uniref:Uncharacterized protein n=1 Tax=Acorus gramineus TaxID=55184 RepID=A0AAV9B682_ACOGR|nr:hypothetical protein QJS04_geneDACA014707 [Acorus gramineus]